MYLRLSRHCRAVGLTGGAAPLSCSTAGTAQPTARATKLRFLCADR